jgi:hypothetical protein
MYILHLGVLTSQTFFECRGMVRKTVKKGKRLDKLKLTVLFTLEECLLICIQYVNFSPID